MRLKTFYKKLARIKEKYLLGKLIMSELNELLKEVKYYLEKEAEKEVDGKLLQHLMGWYLKLWEEKPPEFYRYPKNWTDMVGKELKFLIKLYEELERDIEQLKKEYETFKKSPSRDKSLAFFRTYYLPSVDNKVKELKDKKWTSAKFERGFEYYIKEEKEDLPL